ncbi:MAG: segregation/condensation protein A [Bacilli bacterium]
MSARLISMDYKVILSSFEGPLDLLLHLLKKEDMKIENISIEKITEQYLNFINKMDAFNLNIASEYLVMAAELIEMKSYILLPKQPNEEIIEDSRANLINRLLEYKAYKEVTGEFKILEAERTEIFTKEPSVLNTFVTEEIGKKELSIEILTTAFKKMLEHQEFEKPVDTKITSKEYSIQKRNEEIKNLLIKREKIEFTELFDQYNKEYLVITFLSILELSRKQELEIIQENNFSKIYLINRGN